MKKWRFIIDVAKCENCNNCFLSCKDEHGGNDWAGYSAAQPLHGHRWMNILRTERGRFPLVDVAYLPKPCQHCDDAPCMAAAKNGAVHRRPDGIVLIDPEKARGQKEIVSACPFGAIYWNEETGIPQKCALCAHLLDTGWKAPRCVQACPTGALTVRCLDDHELQALIAAEKLVSLDPGNTSAKPNAYYKNLYRFQSCFIAGSLATGRDTVAECVCGAVVALYKDEKQVGRTRTDDFGDFKFDGLPRDSGSYRIEIGNGDVPLQTVAVTLEDSQAIPTIWI